MAENSVPRMTLNDGNIIPQLGLGVWQTSNEEAETAVGEALRVGYRLIDTAAMYGNEVGVGRAIARSKIARDELFITTKLWNTDQGVDLVKDAFLKSLANLGLDYIDLYLIHWPTPERDRYVETWRVFEELQRAGKIKSIGVSNFNPEHLEKLMAETEIVPAINQIEVHPDFQQADVRQYCHEHGIAVESWSPLGRGGDLLDNAVISRLALLHEKSPAQIVLMWHIQSGLIAIPKSVHAERIEENFNIFDFELSEDDMNELFSLDSGNRLGPDPVEMNA